MNIQEVIQRLSLYDPTLDVRSLATLISTDFGFHSEPEIVGSILEIGLAVVKYPEQTPTLPAKTLPKLLTE